MRAYELINYIPEWLDGGEFFDHGLFSICEGIVDESVSQKDIDFLKSLRSRQISNPKVGDKCIPILVLLLGNGMVSIDGRHGLKTITEITNDEIYFNNEWSYPKERNKRDSLYGRLFLFKNATDAEGFISLLSLKFNQVTKSLKEYVKLHEDATAGATSAGNIATVINPQVAIGRDRGKKSFTGSPGKSGTKAPKLPKIVQPKNSDGTIKNAQDMKGVNIFGGGAVKR